MLIKGFTCVLGIFTPDQHLRFLEFYKKLCTLGLQQENGHNENQIPPQILEQEKKYISVRKNCAYNFPVIHYTFVVAAHFNYKIYEWMTLKTVAIFDTY